MPSWRKEKKEDRKKKTDFSGRFNDNGHEAPRSGAPSRVAARGESNSGRCPPLFGGVRASHGNFFNSRLDLVASKGCFE